MFETLLQTWIQRVYVDVHLLLFFSVHVALPYFTRGLKSVLCYFRSVSDIVIIVKSPKNLCNIRLLHSVQQKPRVYSF